MTLRGTALPPIHSNLVARLLGQLAPAALVAAVGILMLSNLAKAPDATPDKARAETAITAEAVFKITPREVAVAEREQQDAKPAKAAIKPKLIATATPPLRTAVNEPPRQIVSAPLPDPLPIMPQPQGATDPPASERGVMNRLHNATAAVTRIPQWATNSVAGWFAEAAPPRPPAPIPGVNFQASM